MTELFTIQLSSNKFTGTIPSSLFNMPLLRHVNLQDNYLTRSFEIPNSSTSSTLESLLLGNNHFDGKILKPISKLISLKTLELTFLNTSHPIDLRLFSSFKSLSGLDLSGDNIDPTSLSSDSYFPLTLESLYLKECGISKFPTILKTLKNLDFMDIGRNQIKGKIPQWLWSLPRLRSVCLYDNHLSGFQGSSEVLVNSSVMVLMIDANKFEGKFPDLPLFINVVTAARNNFTGEIPLSICNRNSLDSLELSDNNFTGPLPRCLGNLSFLRLRKNNFEGSIPDVFLSGASLRTLDVGFNQITGKLPRSLLNCSSLMFLSVDNNNIEDTFPFSLKALPNLEVMILRSNRFYGPISPPDRGPLGFPKLRIFEIADNKFTGSLSPSYFLGWKGSSLAENEDGGLYMIFDKNINGLQYLYMNHIDLQYKGLHMQHARVLISYSAIDFSGNLLEGNIPESIGLLRKLIALNLSHNSFTGHIPSSLGNLKELESLDMSRNQLSGTIPNGLGNLSFLGFINVSHNQLTGEIPQGTQIIGQPKSSFEGNVGLCGLPLVESCFGTSKQEDEDENEEEEEEQVLNWKGVAVGYGLGVLFGLALAQVIASYKTEWLAKRIGFNNA